MKLHHLTDHLQAKTSQLIDIAKALGQVNPNGGTPIDDSQQSQITAVYRFMSQRQIETPKAAIAQMEAEFLSPDSPLPATEEIAIRIRASVAHELCSRYPTGSMSDRILKALGALSAFEQLHAPQTQSPSP